MYYARNNAKGEIKCENNNINIDMGHVNNNIVNFSDK